MSWDNDVDLYTIGANDPRGDLIDTSAMDSHQLERVGRLMSAMGRLRDVERRVMEASRRYMQLKETDMRAVHYLIGCENQEIAVTPSMLATHLRITTASTTKLLDRLESRGHITRERHRGDRRAIAVTVTPETRAAAMATVGRQHASRVRAAAELTPRQCETVVDFLAQTADDLEAALGADGEM